MPPLAAQGRHILDKKLAKQEVGRKGVAVCARTHIIAIQNLPSKLEALASGFHVAIHVHGLMAGPLLQAALLLLPAVLLVVTALLGGGTGKGGTLWREGGGAYRKRERERENNEMTVKHQSSLIIAVIVLPCA